jgi:hypothetical protein
MRGFTARQRRGAPALQDLVSRQRGTAPRSTHTRLAQRARTTNAVS